MMLQKFQLPYCSNIETMILDWMRLELELVSNISKKMKEFQVMVFAHCLMKRRAT